MIRLVFGIAIGYVLGARAGHARYEQIVRLSSKVSDNPAIQGVAGFAGPRQSRFSCAEKKVDRPVDEPTMMS